MAPDTRVDNINDEFRQHILDGKYGTAGRLPSLRMLAKEFNTTHETMNKVIQRLQAEGLLRSLGRAGVFVNISYKRIPGITPRFDLYLEEMGLTPVETNMKPPAIVPAPAEVAKAFDIEEGSPVVSRFRRQGTPDAHYRLAENFYPVELVNEGIVEQIKYDERFDVLMAIREKHNLIIESAHEDVIARFPSREEIEQLKIVRNTPVFDISRTSYGAKEDGPVIMFSHIICVANYFILSYDYAVPYWRDK